MIMNEIIVKIAFTGWEPPTFKPIRNRVFSRRHEN